MTRQRQPLTRRQREFFDYLRSRMEAGQDAPSLRTAAEELGVSHTAVAGLLQTLQDKGWLRRLRQTYTKIHARRSASRARSFHDR